MLFASFTFVRGPAQFVMFLLTGALIVAFSPGVIAVTQDVVHPGLRAISYAIAVIVQNLLGASTAPIVIGAFSDAYGIQSALRALPLFLVIATILFFAGAFYYERDLSRVARVKLEMED
jgi:fucose permease